MHNAEPLQRFVVLSAKRSGSNLLCTLLHSHPEILCHHEVFNPRGIFYALDLRDGSLDLGSIEERDRDRLGFLERLWTARPGWPFVGFKWTRGQDTEVLQSVLEDPAIKKLVLRRRNRVKTYVSERIAEASDQWEVYRDAQLVSPRPRIEVDVAALHEHIASNERFYASLDADLEPDGAETRPDRIHVDYEQLLEHGEQQRLLEFLGVRDTQRELRPASIKQNSTDLRDLISNFEDLSQQLEPTGLHEELHARGI